MKISTLSFSSALQGCSPGSLSYFKWIRVFRHENTFSDAITNPNRLRDPLRILLTIKLTAQVCLLRACRERRISAALSGSLWLGEILHRPASKAWPAKSPASPSALAAEPERGLWSTKHLLIYGAKPPTDEREEQPRWDANAARVLSSYQINELL